MNEDARFTQGLIEDMKYSKEYRPYNLTCTKYTFLIDDYCRMECECCPVDKISDKETIMWRYA